MPEIGLFYPAVAYLSNKITQIAHNEAKGIYPVVVDFQRLQGIDYTAAQGIEKLLNSFEDKTQLLIFLNVNPSVISSISTMSTAKNFKAIKNEDDLAELLSGNFIYISRIFKNIYLIFYNHLFLFQI